MSSNQARREDSLAGNSREAIRVKNLSKCYHIFPGTRTRLIQLFSSKKKYYEEFWALKDVDLTVKRGEALGVVGLNGAGKSTLLQILAGILSHTTGEVKVDGRIAALLELGMGFSAQFSGRENAYMNGAIIGLSRKEMDRKIEEIRAFAEIGDFFDRPVRMYSSGMKMRLGFAVAVNVTPDILLIDEVLSVGDFRFKQKCLDRIQEMRERMSVVFVSHSMGPILRFCDRVVVLDKGKKTYEGEPEDAVRFYFEEIWNKKDYDFDEDGEMPAKAFQGENYYDENRLDEVTHRWVGRNGESIGSVKHGDEIYLEFSFKLLEPVRNLIIGIPIWDSHGNLLTALNTDVQRIRVPPAKDGWVKGAVNLNPIVFNPGEYHSMLTVLDGPKYLYRQPNVHFRVEEMPLHFGSITLDCDWRFH